MDNEKKETGYTKGRPNDSSVNATIQTRKNYLYTHSVCVCVCVCVCMCVCPSNISVPLLCLTILNFTFTGKTTETKKVANKVCTTCTGTIKTTEERNGGKEILYTTKTQ